MTNLFLLTLVMVLYLATGAAAMPVLAIATAINGTAASPDSAIPATLVALGTTGHSLVKRHDYYLACGQLIQDSRNSKPFVGQEDIKLSRKCLGSPYRYTCDADGDLDWYTTLGQESQECSSHCKCIKRPTYGKPLCLKLGSSAAANICG